MIFISTFDLKENLTYQFPKKDKNHKFISYLQVLKMRNHLYSYQQIY
jgi:hypothetical protein